MVDRIAEPARMSLYPGYVEARAAALEAGAAGVAVSGAGPTLVAVGGGRLGGRGPGHASRPSPSSASRPSSTTRAWTRAARAWSAVERRGRLRRLRRDSALREPRSECACGGLLEVRQEPRLRGRALRALFDRRLGGDADGAGQRRAGAIRELLLPGRGEVVTHPEGNTALYRRAALSQWAAIDDLALKHEGENPTGSFKDRGMTVAVTQAVRGGARAVACASTGNTSASMAAYAAQAGLAGPRVRARGQGGRGQARAVARLRRAHAAREGRLRRLPAPGARGLGRARHLAPQLGEPLAHRGPEDDRAGDAAAARAGIRPDWIVLPAGNLGNTSAFGKALREARGFGLISRLPRIAAVQARGAEPLLPQLPRRASGGAIRVKPETVATAIRIGDPVSHERAVRAIRETNGVVEVVTDARDPGGQGGHRRAAASAASPPPRRPWPARARCGGAASSARGDSVVAILTGHVLKDADAVMRYHASGARGANHPLEIEGRLAEVERVLERR